MRTYRRFMLVFAILTILPLSLNSLLMADTLPLPRTDIAFYNPGFENSNDANANLPEYWQGKNLKKDRLICDGSPKNAPHSGSCAFLFRAKQAKRTNLKQSIFFSDESSKTIDFSLWIKARKLAADSSVTLKTIYYSGDTDVAKVVIPPGTYDYQQLTGSLPITQPNGKLTISIKVGKGAGKLMIDDLALEFTVNGSTLTPTSTPTATNTPDGPTPTPSRTPIGQPTLICNCGE